MDNVEIIKKIIKCGGTIDEAAERFEVTPRTVRCWLKASYKNMKCYYNLLEKARLNKLQKKHEEKHAEFERIEAERAKYEAMMQEQRNREQKEAEICYQQFVSKKMKKVERKIEKLKRNNVSFAVVIDSGFIIDVGMKGIWKLKVPKYIPLFCIEELNRAFDRNVTNACEFEIAMSWANDLLKIRPYKPQVEKLARFVKGIKPRTVGIVATCCDLHARKNKEVIILLTNSKEVKEAAMLQRGIEVFKM